MTQTALQPGEVCTAVRVHGQGLDRSAARPRRFADRVMFWRDGDAAPASGPEVPVNIDPAAEQARINALTGGGQVVIRREPSRGIKLPGL